MGERDTCDRGPANIGPLKAVPARVHHPPMNRYRTWIWVTLIAIAAFVIEYVAVASLVRWWFTQGA